MPHDSICATNSDRVTQVRRWQTVCAQKDAGWLLNAAEAAAAAPSGRETVISNRIHLKKKRCPSIDPRLERTAQHHMFTLQTLQQTEQSCHTKYSRKVVVISHSITGDKSVKIISDQNTACLICFVVSVLQQSHFTYFGRYSNSLILFNGYFNSKNSNLNSSYSQATVCKSVKFDFTYDIYSMYIG